MTQPAIYTTVEQMRQALRPWRNAQERIALVPTMGALHAGHISLTHLARQKAARCVVSIFVNPTQFAPQEDFSKYPRTFEADLAKLAAAGVDGVYAPAPDVMYPQGFATTISLAGPAIAGLEDRFRPTHFAGVATVVAKLFTQAMPDVAVFGEKDYQQLAVIRQMTKDLDLAVDVVGAPTIREDDGLAMSSRNVYLDARERATAPLLHKTLQDCAARIRAGGEAAKSLAEAGKSLTAAGFVLDYLELRDAMSLGAPDPTQRHARMLVAARLGKTRLIDNIPVPLA
ncbi:pantoate--beta-alanine ligase [Roseiarcaceae bacterium H3SJ34-1]|uniref:pantoate--beta-alanine ligase n=1 Tax=Terripilifer ovatus TaxID=3032367 RepID=UPI003AB9477A|nr:pantoate--beta-alanine ligase [Roseiarcaceae bacterium H3SJ34-1]